MADTRDPQWFLNYAGQADAMQPPWSIEEMLERDAHDSMYRELYADAQKTLDRLCEELHRERELRQAAEADRRRMLRLLLQYMTTTTADLRRDDQTFEMRAKVSPNLLALARDPEMVIAATLEKLARQAKRELAARRAAHPGATP